MKYYLITILLISSINSFACSCICNSDCSFVKMAKTSTMVALVKVISYDNYIIVKDLGSTKKIPQSMILEIIKLYKGAKTYKKIKIWGDNGMLCRPYVSYFKIGEYFLVAPNKILNIQIKGETKFDFEFFSCSTDYLKVDMRTKNALGQYSKNINKISIMEFEKTFN